MATAGDALREIRALFDNVEKGRKFELLFLRTAKCVPELEIKNIWRWSHWPGLKEHGFTANDIGIDLVAETNAGTRIAIQCKCYDENYKVTKGDVTNFIAAAVERTFPLRWFVATCDYNTTAQKLIAKNGIRIIDFGSYHDTDLDGTPPTREPWALQKEAIDAVLSGFKESGRDRGRLIMACGTGKTFTSLRIVEQLEARTILFIAPSIALVAQTRREWLRHSQRPLSCTVICSDSTAGAAEDASTTEISCETTTDPARIAAALAVDIPRDTVRAVFCTYQSLNKLSTAQRAHNAPKFDIAIVDEAHRTTGYLDETRAGLFQTIHDNEKIATGKRLYMTATPRIYEDKKGTHKNSDVTDAHIVDMNDVETYGPEFYRLSFKDAVEADMLCDYHVIALGITEGEMDGALTETLFQLNDDIGGVGKAADAQAFLALGAIALAINGKVRGANAPGVLARTIAYASNIRRSRWLAEALMKGELREWLRGDAADLRTEHLDGTSSALQRNNALRKLNTATENQPRLIANARLFTEGVDVPALNAVAFLDPRQSKVDTIQAVGRVMRRDRASDKVMGYIVVPVILPTNADLLDTLSEQQSRFKTLGVVLRALQSHDERLFTELTNRLTFETLKPQGPATPQHENYAPVQLTLLDANAKQAIYAQLANKTGIGQQGKVIAAAITQAVNRAARLFEQEGVTSIIAKTIGTPSENEAESCKTAALLIVNACIMHKRLEQSGNLGGLTRISAANRVANPSSALLGAWLTILEKDYAPVFQDAVALLQRLPETGAIANAITHLIQCAIDNATTLNELGFDHAGPLYHSVLGSAQSDGAFYTKNLSGYLLAGLAFDEKLINWGDANAVQNLKIIDPACGTGTLLMAALNIIKKRAAAAQHLDEDAANELHKKLVENAMYGFDINKYSVQLAACNLTIGAPNTDYERMNLHTLMHGPVKDTDGATVENVRHGALEKLLDQGMNQMEKVLQPPPPVYGASVTNRELAEVAMPEKFDAVVYNPPFTETLNQSRRYTEQTRQAMAERLQFIKTELGSRDPAATGALAKRSIRPYFTPLTTGMLRSGGKLAKVLPATACTSENGRTERQYIANNFHVEMVVTSHDPKNINFSENTNIHECLVIGTRGNNADNKPTRFIQLAAYPKNVTDADELIAAITHPPRGERELPLYTETVWSADKVRSGDWTPVQWCSPKLVEAAASIERFKNLRLTNDIHHWKIKNATFYTTFTYEHSEHGNCFCTINKNQVQTIQAIPESAATPKSGKESTASRVYAEADHVLLACRMRTTTTRVVAVYSEKPAISGGAYSAIGVGDKETAKVYAAFINSSFGILQLLNKRSSKLTYPKFENGQMKTLMLPNPRKANLAPLLDAFEQVKNTPLQRLALCAEDPARKILDHAAAKSIGVDPAVTDQWREWLSQEPTITNERYTGKN